MFSKYASNPKIVGAVGLAVGYYFGRGYELKVIFQKATD